MLRMTMAEKQLWLWRYQKARPRLNRLNEKMYELVQQKTGLQQLMAGLRPDEAVQFEARRRRLEESIRLAAAQLMEIDRMRLEVAQTIDRLEEPRLRQVLGYHYLQGEPWQNVACRMQYSQRYIYDLHRRALEELPIPPGARKPHPYRGPCRMYCMGGREACA